MNVHNLASTSVPFKLTTVQVPNLALTHTKLLTVYYRAAPCTYLANKIHGTWSVLGGHLTRVKDAFDLCKKGTYMGDIYRLWIFDCMRRALDLNGGSFTWPPWVGIRPEWGGHALDLCRLALDLNVCTLHKTSETRAFDLNGGGGDMHLTFVRYRHLTWTGDMHLTCVR